MRADRLLKLADFLETVPPEAFDMHTWADQKPCGFSGCAIGWAIHGKLFEGFHWERTDHEATEWEPAYDGETALEAIAALFEIEQCKSESLFSAWLRDTPHGVADRIRKFVADHSKSPALSKAGATI